MSAVLDQPLPTRRTAASTTHVTPLAAPLGALVQGVDAAKPLGAATRTEIDDLQLITYNPFLRRLTPTTGRSTTSSTGTTRPRCMPKRRSMPTSGASSSASAWRARGRFEAQGPRRWPAPFEDPPQAPFTHGWGAAGRSAVGRAADR
jgi:hypothetical protein